MGIMVLRHLATKLSGMMEWREAAIRIYDVKAFKPGVETSSVGPLA